MASEADESSTPVRVRAPIGVRVAANVEALRKAHGWSQQQLSQRMAELGRPLIVTAVSKVEQGQRRVDVDDLVALALALGVNPGRLLLTDEAGDEPVELAPNFTAPAWGAWQWSDGRHPVPTRGEAEGYNTDEEYEAFTTYSRPAAIRRQEQEPLARAASSLLSRVYRLVSRDSGSETGRKLARRDLERVAFELDALDEDQEAPRR